MNIKKEHIAIGVSIAVVAWLLFGGFIWSLFTNPVSSSNMEIPTTGVNAVDTVPGQGEAAAPGDVLTVHYTGTLTNGQVFDSSKDRGQPISFTLGSGQVIRGWDQGLVGMREGGRRKLVIAPDYAYGASAVGAIPANSVLVFEVELLEVNKAQ